MFEKFHNAISETWGGWRTPWQERACAECSAGGALRCPGPSWPGHPSPPEGPPLQGPEPVHTFRRSLTGPKCHARPHLVPTVLLLGGWSQGAPEQWPLFLPGVFTCQCLSSAFLSGGLSESVDGCELIMDPLSPGGGRAGGTLGGDGEGRATPAAGCGRQDAQWAFSSLGFQVVSPALCIRSQVGWGEGLQCRA